MTDMCCISLGGSFILLLLFKNYSYRLTDLMACHDKKKTSNFKHFVLLMKTLLLLITHLHDRRFIEKPNHVVLFYNS